MVGFIGTYVDQTCNGRASTAIVGLVVGIDSDKSLEYTEGTMDDCLFLRVASIAKVGEAKACERSAFVIAI